MAFNSKEKVHLFMEKCLKVFKLSELEDLVPEYFDINFSEIADGIKKRKIQMSKQNVVELVLHTMEKAQWPTEDILNTAFHMELEFTLKYHRRFNWMAHKFIGDSSKDEILDLESDMRRAIRSEKKDALVLIKNTDGLFWISVVMKDLKKIGLYKRPFYIALSESGKYFFIRRLDQDSILEVLGTTLGYKKFKKVKLFGKDIKSLVKLLVRRETVDMSKRPVYSGGEAVENEYGVDMTQKKSYEDYYMQCVDNDDEIYIQHYNIAAVKCPWMGSDVPLLRDMQFDSSITLSGNVARIIKALPIANMIRPPFPDFFVNFSVEGKNQIKTSRTVEEVE